MNPKFEEFKTGFRDMSLTAYLEHCDRVAADCAKIRDDSSRRACEQSLEKIRRWFKHRQDFSQDIAREITTIEGALSS